MSRPARRRPARQTREQALSAADPPGRSDWEHDHYAVVCKKCGAAGWLAVSPHHWNRMGAHWEGFAEIRTSPTHPSISECRCLTCGNKRAIDIAFVGSTQE